MVLATSAACHILGGAVVTAVGMINFPQAVVLGLGLTALMALSRPATNVTTIVTGTAGRREDKETRGSTAVKFTRLLILQLATPEGVVLVARFLGALPALESEWRVLVRQWAMLGNWFVPGFLGVWWVLQLVVCTMLWV